MLVAAALVLGGTGTVRAASETVALYPTDYWVWRVTPVLGPQSYDGSLRVEGEKGSVSSSLDDIADKASFQMDVLVEGHGDKLGLLFGLSYMALNADIKNENEAANLSAGLLSIDALGSYGLGPWDIGTASAGFEVLGGGRFNQFDAKIETKNSGTADAGRGWVDPVVGGRVTANFDFPLRLEARGDWGGFGVGSATDLTWRFWGAAHYKIDPVIEVFAGYRMTDIKSQHQSGSGGTALDGRTQGPVIGITFIIGG
jgi:hypothetical protein